MKVPEDVRERLLEERETEIFVPMGKHKMTEWVLITKKNSDDYLEHEDDFISSLEY